MRYLINTVMAVAVVLMLCGCIGGGESDLTTQTTEKKVATTVKEVATTVEGPTTTTKVATTTIKATTTTQEAVSSVLNDLAAAVSSNLAYKCTYTYESTKIESWIKGQKSYMEMAVEGVNAYTLNDGTWMYTWMDGQTTGTKINLEDSKKLASGQSQADVTEMSNTAVNVVCTPDLLAESKFTPPKNIEFMDMGALLKQMGGA